MGTKNLHQRHDEYVVNAPPIRGPLTKPSCETREDKLIRAGLNIARIVYIQSLPPIIMPISAVQHRQ